MALKPQYKRGTPVLIHVGGKWREGYYQGLCRWDQCHRVTAKKAMNSADWILPPGTDIKRDLRKRK